MAPYTRKSSILGPDGRPIEAAVLDQEIATPELSGVRRVAEDRVATGLTPARLATVLREAESIDPRRYLTLAEEMEERYLHYASQLQTRRLAIEGVDFTVEVPDGVPAKIGDAVNELVETDEFQEAAAFLSDGISKGYSVVEIGWEYTSGLLRPVRFDWRDPRFFVWDRKTFRELRLASDHNRDGEELPSGKFMIHRPRSKAGIPIRAGLARPAAWAFMIQGFALKDWAAFSEIYGVPLRLGKYGQNATEADKRTLLRAVRAIANDAAAIIPESMIMEFQKVEGQHGAAVFGKLIDYVDQNVSKLVVGQTMTADDGSSMAQAEVHNDVRRDILVADCKQETRTINRDLIQYFVAMNFGPQDVYPRAERRVPDPEDVEALTGAIAALVPLGLKVKQSEMRNKLGLSDPDDEDELLTAPAPATKEPRRAGEDDGSEDKKPAKDKSDLSAVGHHGGCRCASCRTKSASLAAGIEAGGELDALLEDALADWEDVTDPILAPIRRVLARATSFKEALAMIDEQGPDGKRLAEQLAIATAKARGLGDVSD